MPRKLLGPNDPEPVGLRNAEARSPFLLICDHAGNAVPSLLQNLRLAQADLDRHIGIDIGILGVSERLADLLEAPLVSQRYSRLVAECNRLLTSPESVATVSDGTLIPGYQDLTAEARERRIAEIAVPYHREITRRLDALSAMNEPVILVSMHSFTPSLLSRSFQRPWPVGLCFGPDDRFTQPVLSLLDREGGFLVGRNEPYGVDMAKSYSIPIHGEGRGLPYAEFEIRQDLIATADGQAEWAERLNRVLRGAHRLFVDAGHGT